MSAQGVCDSKSHCVSNFTARSRFTTRSIFSTAGSFVNVRQSKHLIGAQPVLESYDVF